MNERSSESRTAASSSAEVSVIVVTYNAMPWIEPCLESVHGCELIVVDHGSSDGTLELMRERFPEAHLIKQENRGLGAGWNTGMRAARGKCYLLLNADAWVVAGGVARLVDVLERNPAAAIVGPLLRNRDGTLQRSVRGFPTLWRLATEYFLLRKLAPRTRLFNAFYGGGFRHDRELEAEFLMGAALLVRPQAVNEVGGLDERFFLFSEEVDWCYRFRQAGWKILFTPTAEVVHVGGASHGGKLFREQVQGHLLFLEKHRGVRTARVARALLLVSLTIRGLVFPGSRGRMYRDAARWLRSGPLQVLLAWRR
ncbi:MAG: glycosyltransferase family 2 protein [Gaiellaceae bacterium]|jgi:GT2 family glycosyltransferase